LCPPTPPTTKATPPRHVLPDTPLLRRADFRGPAGVWTLQRAGKPLPPLPVAFAYARPSLTHMAIAELVRRGKCAYVVSQNVDGLHLRSGVPRGRLAELHGNCFTERCRRCRAEYVRDFEVETVGFRATGRPCSRPGCRGRLHDHVLDWEDALPEDELGEAERQCERCDVVLCLGTSLQIQPANTIPLRTARAGGAVVIVNLQRTPRDGRAALLVRGRADDVMRGVMSRLGVPVPDFVRHDEVAVGVAVELRGDGPPPRKRARGPGGGDGGAGGGRVVFMLSSLHGRDCEMPMVDRATLTDPSGRAWEDEDLAFERVPGQGLRAEAPLPAGGAGGAPGRLGAGWILIRFGEHFSVEGEEGEGREARVRFEVLGPGAGAGEGPGAKEEPGGRGEGDAPAGASEVELAWAAGRGAGGAGTGTARVVLRVDGGAGQGTLRRCGAEDLARGLGAGRAGWETDPAHLAVLRCLTQRASYG